MGKAIDPKNITVALLAGGASGERTISLASGAGAREALETAGFTVVTIDPIMKDDLNTLVNGHFDVAFICLHGRYGEDGTIQGLLEVLGIPYIGSGVWSSSLAIDKPKAKVFYEHFGINTPKSVTLHYRGQYTGQQLLDKLGTPCVIKPATEGSALGVHLAVTAEEAEAAMEDVFNRDNGALAETYISGTELTVSVIGNNNPRALPIIEIVPTHDFYDFESKYAPGGSEHICPARLDDATTAKVQDMAIRAHKTLGCRGVSRTDIIMDENGVCWALETNTVPGMTNTSLLPDAANAAGISFPELCTMLIEYALEDTDASRK